MKCIAFLHRCNTFLGHLGSVPGFLVIDGVFEADRQGGVRFVAAEALDGADAEAIQGQVRRRILQASLRRGLLEKDERAEMARWEHGGGFSLDATVRIAANDRRALERLLR